MSDKQMRWGLRKWAIGAMALGLAAICSWGQGAEGIALPLYAGNIVPLHDEFGRPMRGSPQASAAASRPLVEVRIAYTNRNAAGEIFAPGTNGVSSPYNPMVSTNAGDVAGMGLNSAATNSGLFCLVLAKRPADKTLIFARAFNAPTAAAATFYADSVPVEVKSNETAVVLSFGAMKALNSGDADGDGLSDSWEALLGIDDRLTPDYDNDGMSDLNEMLAGTAPDDASSKLAFRTIQRERTPQVLEEGAEPTRPARVKWQSVPGKRYQLEYVVSLPGDQIFIPVGDVVTAGAGEFEIEMLVDLPEDALTGTFRVKLVQE